MNHDWIVSWCDMASGETFTYRFSGPKEELVAAIYLGWRLDEYDKVEIKHMENGEIDFYATNKKKKEIRIKAEMEMSLPNLRCMI